METSQRTLELLKIGGVVPVVRLPDLSRAAAMAQALLEGGVTALELTMTSPGALEALDLLRQEIPAFANGAAALGMGSVLNPEMAASAIARGAQFIVAPVLDLPTLGLCVERNVPAMPGAFTPTEIQTAWTAGAAVVKVFPRNQTGPRLLQRPARPSATPQADPHRRRRPGKLRRLHPRRRRSRRRGKRARTQRLGRERQLGRADQDGGQFYSHRSRSAYDVVSRPLHSRSRDPGPYRSS